MNNTKTNTKVLKREKRLRDTAPFRNPPPKVAKYVPITKRDKKKLKIPKDQKGITPEQAFARASSLAPTRLTLNVGIDNFLATIRAIAILCSYEIQSKGRLPYFASDQAYIWNPSTVYAYLLTCATSYLARVGALPASSQYTVAKQYKVPTFYGKWLQQVFGKATHMDRNIVSFLNATAESLLSTDCGTGGIGNMPGFANAPCYIPTPGDNEGWYSVIGTGQSVITPSDVSNDVSNKISSIFDKVFRHTVAMGEVAEEASNTELKITPVAPGFTGDFLYSCVDAETMCDLILPLANVNLPDLVNSFGPVQSAAPVRIDGGLCAAPQAKFAFLFWLANNNAYHRKDSFKGYLRKFGVKEKHMGNLQINIRQLNWNGLFNACMAYLQTFTNLDGAYYWYFVNYVATILLSNIPGCIRAISPISLGWNLAPLFPNTSPDSVYASFTKNPKMPPFLAQIVECLRTPIRYENQISFFINVLPAQTTLNWWSQVATASGVNLGSGQTYGQVPSCPYTTGMTVANGPYRPYPNCTVQAVPGDYPVDATRNYFPIFGIGATAGALSTRLVNTNGETNLYNQWGSKSVQFTRRMAKYILVSQLSSSPNVYPVTSPGFAVSFPVPVLLASWEPGSHHTACLAVSMPIHYYSPTQDGQNGVTIGPVFAADPVASATDSLSPSMAAASPGQGTSQAVVVGKSANPQEVQSHMAAEAAQGVVPDSSQPPPEHLKETVKKKLTSSVKTIADDGIKAAGDFLGDVLNKAI